MTKLCNWKTIRLGVVSAVSAAMVFASGGAWAATRPVELTEASFAAALSAAKAGDVIEIPEGTLTLSTGYTVSKAVTIRGSGDRATIIKTTSTTACPFTVKDNGAVLENMTIDGCVIAGAEASAWDYTPAAVELVLGLLTNVTVRNCRPVAGYHVTAVRLGYQQYSGSNHARMSACTITNNVLGNTIASYTTVKVHRGIVSHCEIAYNKGRGSVGFYLAPLNDSVSCRLEDCDVHHNVCYPASELAEGVEVGNGGGGRADGGSVLRCAITNNVTYANGGGLWLRGGTVENCLVAKNTAAVSGGGIFANNKTPVVRFCNIGGNTAPTGPGAAAAVAASFSACLIADNAASSASDISIDSGVNAVFDNCCLRPATYDYYNPAVSSPKWNKQIGSEPVFRADGSYLTIDDNSCVAVDSTNVSITDDYFGRKRPIDGMTGRHTSGGLPRYDVGCCEYDPHFDGTVYVSKTGGHVFPYATPETAATNIEAAIGVCTNLAITVYPRIVLAPGVYTNASVVTVPKRTTLCGATPLGSVVLMRTTVGDGVIGLDDVSSVVSNLAIRGGIGCGSDDSTPGPSGLWVKRGLAVDCEISGCTIDPAAYANESRHAQALVLGAEARALRCIVTNNVGSFGANSLDGKWPHGAGVFLGKGSRLESCEIAYNTGNIGGVYASGANAGYDPCVLKDCYIHDNFAYTTGGGILAACSQSVYRNCRIVNNRVSASTQSAPYSWGGGVRASVPATFVNCLIAGNEADQGAGCVFDCNLSLLHCTVAGNHARTTAGGLWSLDTSSATIVLLDTVIAGNTSPDDIELESAQSQGTDSSITFCFLPEGRYSLPDSGLVMSNNVIAANAKFRNAAAGDYRFMGGSPCIDAGTDAYPADFAAFVTKDLDGVDRPQDGRGTGTPRPDFGCYEYLRKLGLIISFR